MWNKEGSTSGPAEGMLVLCVTSNRERITLAHFSAMANSISEDFVNHPCHVLQGHDVALEKLPSKVAAIVPREQLQHAVATAGLPAKGARFVNLAELAALEALQVTHHCPASVQALSADWECSHQTSQQCFPVLMAT